MKYAAFPRPAQAPRPGLTGTTLSTEPARGAVPPQDEALATALKRLEVNGDLCPGR